MSTNVMKTIRQALKDATEKAEEVMKQAETEERVLTQEERAEVDKHLAIAREKKDELERAQGDAATRQALADIGFKPASEEPRGARDAERTHEPRLRSLGQQFVDSEAYAFVREGHAKGHRWQTPTVEIHDPMAATLTQDPASGGALVWPDLRPGIQPLLFRPIRVTNLIADGTTDSNTVTYMQELTFVNAAETVGETELKPESTLTFGLVNEPVRKIAHWLPVSDEMLEDVAQIRSYIDARLRLGLDLVEEDQILNGDGVAPNLLGIRNRPGLAPDVVKGAGETNADAIFRQMMDIMWSAFVMPDGIVINPLNWQPIVLSKTTTGEYLGPGPFTTPAAPVLWGLPAAVTPLMTAGESLVGAYRTQAQRFRRGGIQVDASNSHGNFFIHNLTAIRAEKRLALAVYRPGAFGHVTALD